MGRASWFNEFIPYDFANLLPHSFAFHTNRQIGDVLVYTGAGTGIAANGYSWQQQTNSSSSLTIENQVPKIEFSSERQRCQAKF